MPLRIGSYNCQSVTANFDFIASLLTDLDVLLLQETFLHEHNKDILSSFGAEFDFAYVSSTRNADSFVGRSKGGLAIVWRNINEVEYVPQFFNERIMGIKLQYNFSTYLLLNVYLPCDYGDVNSLIDYKFQLAELNNIVLQESYDEIMIIGDFNSDPHKGRFFHELSKFVDEFSLIVRDIQNMSPDSYTYISRSNICSTSWLDHVVTSSTCFPRNFGIMYGSTFDDHIPLVFILDFDIEHVTQVSKRCASSESFKVDWKNVNNSCISDYCNVLDSFMNSYSNDVLFSCCNKDCRDVGHLSAIDDAYSYLVRNISLASKRCFPSLSRVDRKFNIIPGWNDECKEAHALARSSFLAWHESGRALEMF